MYSRVVIAFGIVLLVAGGSAFFLLRRLPPKQKPPVKTGCSYVPPARPVVWLFSRQEEDGSWGSGPATLEGRSLGRTGLAALALLPLFHAGYMPYSKETDVFGDEANGRTSGGQVLKAAGWLVRQQKIDGTFAEVSDGTLDQALATYALAELVGVTTNPDWKTPAQRAADALLRIQKPDGSWEGAGPTAWAILALNSARLSELDIDLKRYELALASWPYPAHPAQALTLALRKDAGAPAALERLLEDARDRDPGNAPFWYLATLAVYVQDGPRLRSRLYPEDKRPGPAWERWGTILRAKLPTPWKDGPLPEAGFPGDFVVRVSVTMLAWEVFYGYGAAFLPR